MQAITSKNSKQAQSPATLPDAEVQQHLSRLRQNQATAASATAKAGITPAKVTPALQPTLAKATPATKGQRASEEILHENRIGELLDRNAEALRAGAKAQAPKATAAKGRARGAMLLDQAARGAVGKTEQKIRAAEKANATGRATPAVAAQPATTKGKAKIAKGAEMAPGSNAVSRHNAKVIVAAKPAKGAQVPALPVKPATKAKGGAKAALLQAAGVAPAPKPAKQGKAPASRAKTTERNYGQPAPAVPKEGKIIINAPANPYKAGTKAHNTFTLMGKAGTIAGFRAGVAKAPDNYDAGYLRYASRDGFISFKA